MAAAPAQAWHLGELCPVDLETTDKDPFQARIVQAYVGLVGGPVPDDPAPWLINPQVPIPADTTKIHRITDEMVQAEGMDAAAGIDMTVEILADNLSRGVPLVGHNIGTYDLTVLEAECRRHGLPTLSERTGNRVGPVIDTYVISKRLDRWRRRVSKDQGAHQLKTCAQVFKVDWVDADAHGARYDALISARVAWRMGAIAFTPAELRPRIQSGRGDERGLFDDLAVDLRQLHANQKRWAAEQAASYQEWLRSPKAKEKQDAGAVINGEWPIQYAPAARQEALATP